MPADLLTTSGKHTQVFRRPADKERSIVMTNACFVKWFDVLKDKTGLNLFCCTLRLWKRASVCCGGLCSCVMDSAWQSALRQQLRTEKASQGNIKTFQGKKDKFQYKHSLIIQGRGLVAWYATAACLSMLISCNGPSTSSVSKNLCSQHR